MQGFHELLLENEFAQAKQLLAEAGLDLPEGISFALGFFAEGTLVGTGFLAGNIVCGLCVHPAHQGEGLAVQIVSRLVQQGLQTGCSKLFIFTKPQEVEKFSSIGFTLVAAATKAALLEWGSPSCATWLAETQEQIHNTLAPNAPYGCIVMNANPFTLGHLHLVLEARKKCSTVVVFVVQEDASVFPFAIRYELVQRGIAGIPGTMALPAGPYMVSQASFPSYFTGKRGHAAAYAELDSTIFAERIAPALEICHRFVGEEPYCEVTAAYNKALAKVLAGHAIELTEIPREQAAKQIISASTVRKLLQQPISEDTWQQVAQFVPAPVLQFLREDPRAEAILQRLSHYKKRH